MGTIKRDSSTPWWYLRYLLHSLRCDYGGDCAALLDHHALLVTGVDLLTVQVASGRLRVRLHGRNNRT